MRDTPDCKYCGLPTVFLSAFGVLDWWWCPSCGRAHSKPSVNLGDAGEPSQPEESLSADRVRSGSTC